MTMHLLILGGTTEASALARLVSDAGIAATFSYAGRTETPKTQPLPTRVGGFGGAEGLCRYITENSITHVVDATHPFAAQMSWNAYTACHAAQIPLVALTRPAWQAQAGDDWRTVADISAAVEVLRQLPRKRVMLALGRMHVAEFEVAPQHHYVLRFVDQPDEVPPLPDHRVVVARGPFGLAADRRLFEEMAIDLIVCKNAGGAGAEAKIHAARALGLPVIMINRPSLPDRVECATAELTLDWLQSVD